jgi:hypothetical protein
MEHVGAAVVLSLVQAEDLSSRLPVSAGASWRISEQAAAAM